jgi:cellulose synthase/poly-beta-1,6-N-acetylglucosamine synthase-like glycosyltransferase
MGFSSQIIQRYGWNAFSITENWEYYVRLTLNGHVVRYAPDAVIFSHAVTALSHGETQRKRWFKGRMDILVNFSLSLIKCAFRSRQANCMDTLIELASPSYSMLLIWSLISLVLTALLGAAHAIPASWIIWPFVLFVLLGVLFAAGLFVSKAPWKTWFQLLYLPIFLAWKLTVTVKGLLSYGDKTWQKTERKLQ